MEKVRLLVFILCFGYRMMGLYSGLLCQLFGVREERDKP